MSSSSSSTELLVGERPQGRFSRRQFLGETLDTEHIDARYTDGVLTLKVPVAERAKPRRVAVRAVDASAAIDLGATPKAVRNGDDRTNAAKFESREPVGSAV